MVNMATINTQLQTILNNFATQTGGTSSVLYQNMLATINASTILLERFNAAASAGTFTQFNLVTSTSAYMYSNGNTITVSSQILSDGSFYQGRFVFQMSHEISHCETASSRISQESTWLNNAKNFISATSGNPNITGYLSDYINIYLRDEGRANIQGYNGLLDYTLSNNGGLPLTDEQRIRMTSSATNGTYLATQFIDPLTGALKSGYTFDASGYIVLDTSSITSSTAFYANLSPSDAGTLNEKYAHHYASYGLQRIASVANGKTLTLDYNALSLDISSTVLGQALSIEEINDVLVRDHLRPQASPRFTSLTLVDPLGKYKSEFTANTLGSVTVKTTTGIGDLITHSATKDYMSTTYNGAQKEILAQTVVFDKNNSTTETSYFKIVFDTSDLASNSHILSQTQSTTTAAGVITTLIDANGDGIFETTRIGVDADRNGVEDVTVFTGTSGKDNLSGAATDDTLNGLAGNDTLNGLAGNDTLDGGAGGDSMVGGLGNDVYIVDSSQDRVTELNNQGTDWVNSSINYTLGNYLENLTLLGSAALTGTGNALGNQLRGNSAANTLNGAAGNDTLTGGLGADILIGGTGNDSYMFARNDGADQLTDSDSTTGNTDVLWFNSGVDNDQLWFQRVNQDLEISVIGSTDKVTVKNWYNGAANQVEQIKSSNGKVLSNAGVDALVSAMSAFSPPVSGQLVLPDAYATSLSSVIVANWQ